jgi:hypothetical protein
MERAEDLEEGGFDFGGVAGSRSASEHLLHNKGIVISFDKEDSRVVAHRDTPPS